MTFKISEITLPYDPSQAVFKFEKDAKKIALLRQLPFLLHLGPKVPVLKIEGIIAVQGQDAAYLETNFLLPLRDKVITPAAYPRKIADDDQSTLWTWTSAGGATANLTDVTSPCVKGKNALKVDITWNAATEGAIYIAYSPAKDFSKQDFITWWLYGDNSGRTIQLRFPQTLWTDYFYYNIVVNWSGWKRLWLQKSAFLTIGTPSWSSIIRADHKFSKQGTESGAILYCDRHMVGVGDYVDGPDTRYDGLYLVMDFKWTETYKMLGVFPYELELWLEDDYY